MAERQEARVGRRVPRSVAVQRRMDTRFQGTVWRQTIGHDQRQVRGDLGQRAAGRLRVRDVR